MPLTNDFTIVGALLIDKYLYFAKNGFHLVRRISNSSLSVPKSGSMGPERTILNRLQVSYNKGLVRPAKKAGNLTGIGNADELQ